MGAASVPLTSAAVATIQTHTRWAERTRLGRIKCVCTLGWGSRRKARGAGGMGARGQGSSPWWILQGYPCCRLLRSASEGHWPQYLSHGSISACKSEGANLEAPLTESSYVIQSSNSACAHVCVYACVRRGGYAPLLFWVRRGSPEKSRAPTPAVGKLSSGPGFYDANSRNEN